MTQHWLLKTEPDAFSIDDLINCAKQTERWDGIRNYQARNFIRDTVKKGDLCFIYHSQCKQVGIVGIAEVVSSAYADPAQFNPENKYYDPKATEENPRWFCMDIQFVEKFNQPVLLKTLKQQEKLSEMVLVKQGRLSVQPVTTKEWKAICSMAKNS